MNQLPTAPPRLSGCTVSWMRALSGGIYRLWMNGVGTGFSSLGNVALTSPWPGGRSGGSRFYFRDLGSGALWAPSWTASWQPGRVSLTADLDAMTVCHEQCVVPERN